MNNINWLEILEKAVSTVEKNLEVKLIIEHLVVEEIKKYILATSNNLETRPNVAKSAGLVAFWIRKLKPVSHHPDSEKTNTLVNEVIAIHTGLGICKNYFDDGTKDKPWKYDGRVVTDWANSLRYNSHSPHSSMILFEFIGSQLNK